MVEAGQSSIANITRESWGRVLALLTSRLRDLQLAEDMLQDAILKALESWPSSGVPKNPQAWLYRVAMNRAIDQLLRGQKLDMQPFEDLAERLSMSDSVDTTFNQQEIPDERLRMIFTCCHPAIARDAQMGLTLRSSP